MQTISGTVTQAHTFFGWPWHWKSDHISFIVCGRLTEIRWNFVGKWAFRPELIWFFFKLFFPAGVWDNLNLPNKSYQESCCHQCDRTKLPKAFAENQKKMNFKRNLTLLWKIKNGNFHSYPIPCTQCLGFLILYDIFRFPCSALYNNRDPVTCDSLWHPSPKVFRLLHCLLRFPCFLPKPHNRKSLQDPNV